MGRCRPVSDSEADAMEVLSQSCFFESVGICKSLNS